MKRVKVFMAVLIALLLISPVFAESTPIDGLSFFKLDNGLELFVLENHSVPLTKIQVTFRCGALTQVPETTGLFHLYEHMLFKGNKKYKTETEFSAALTELGVSGWNGGTSTEYVTYYITLPSDKTDKGLEFWSYAMRDPLFDERELEIEKGVVCNEINGDYAEPNAPAGCMITKTMYPKFPWRRDVRGTDKIVRSCTPQMLRDMQHTYYIPNNAAVFVAGDVNPKDVLAAVKKYYGDWEKGKDPWNPMPEPQAFPGVQEPVYMVFPTPGLPKGIAVMELIMRGPDVVRDPEATYAADVWGSLIGSPAGKYKENIFKGVEGQYDKTEIWGSYYTQRDGGQITFGSVAFADPKAPLASRAKKFERVVYDEMNKIMTDAAYFEKKEFDSVKIHLEDEQILGLEKPENFLDTLSFWWSTSSADYYFNYIKNMNKVSQAEINKFLQTYVIQNKPIIFVELNPADYAAEAEHFKKEGYILVTRDNCFWWGDKK